MMAERRLLYQHRWFPDTRDAGPLSPADFRLQPGSLVPCKFRNERKKLRMSYLHHANLLTERRLLHQHRRLPDTGHPGSFGLDCEHFPWSLMATALLSMHRPAQEGL